MNKWETIIEFRAHLGFVLWGRQEWSPRVYKGSGLGLRVDLTSTKMAVTPLLNPVIPISKLLIRSTRPPKHIPVPQQPLESPCRREIFHSPSIKSYRYIRTSSDHMRSYTSLFLLA